MNTRSGHRRQAGVAAIVALLMAAAAALIGVSVLEWHAASVQRSANVAAAAQIREYVRGLQVWAAAILRRDARDTTHDYAGEPWHAPIPDIPVPDGVLRGRLTDLDGRFNVNNLLAEDGQIDEVEFARLERLLGALDISPAVAAAIADWVDADGTPRGDGAEDNVYLRRRDSHRAANRPLRDMTELRLINGITEAVYQRLAPHVAALPQGARLNVNTATPQVLMTIHQGITYSLAETISNGGRANFRNLDDFLKHPGIEVLGLSDDVRQRIGTRSSFFRAESEIEVGDVEMRYVSILRRTGLNVEVMATWPEGFAAPRPATTGATSG